MSRMTCGVKSPLQVAFAHAGLCAQRLVTTIRPRLAACGLTKATGDGASAGFSASVVDVDWF
ncbi:hypothetical protein CCHR01_02341 [Colletotrichum chrysophilum]|uniref:Uncharacterized protein n=1 Tax=Colletotrichum chrysophilum TaxID=1836956 RepID=A0AAD9AUZ1_9PEZI|nr:hypothetical protein CCHR01_02341 [Colletotrichum chrysophilum]